MRSKTRASSTIFLSIILASLISAAMAIADEHDRPRLAVLIVFDQLRGDYLVRWERHFGEGGFRRLQTEGAWFQNCHYPYSGTLTGAGHASLLTGCSPARHGIVGNDWFDRASGKSINCVYSLRHERVPSRADATLGGLSSDQDRGKVSPEQMLVPSFGDSLKEATKGESRIVALSMKDRSAVLPAGKHPDACYWFDAETGNFVTSNYYRDEIHTWVDEYNRQRRVNAWFDKEWTRFRADLDYTRVCGPDDVAGEGNGVKQGRTFPHPMTGGLSEPGPASYKAVYSSPFGNELLLELAKRAIDSEKLGRHDVPDLLTISFSSNDAIGHNWGPDSQEVFDATLRSDQIMKELLTYLDAQIGKGRYILALTADHGVCSLPEVASGQGRDAGRASSSALLKEANEYLEATFGNGIGDKSRWTEGVSNGWFFLNRSTLRERNVREDVVEKSLCDWLRKQAGVSQAYSRHQLQSGLANNDEQGQRVLRSFFPDRCCNVLVIVKPNWLLGDSTTGTTHGSPHRYDSHVPLLVFGPTVTARRTDELVSPTSIAAIFAHAMSIPVPRDADTPVPKGLFSDVAAR